MATFKATFFSNRRRKDGTYSIKIRITHNRKSRYIPTSLYATDRDITKGMKIKDETIRLAVEDQILQFRKICNEVGPAIESMDVDQVIDFLMSPKCGFDLDFISYGREVIQKMKTAGQTGNAKVYNIALNSLSNYVNGRSLSIHEISARFVREYIDYLEGSRAKSLYPATLRAIHNRAKEEFNDEVRGIVNIPYSPFSRLKMKAPVAKKRAISLEQIQYIIDLPYAPDKFLTPGHYNRINFAKDIFVLSFALMGMNVADLFECSKYENVRFPVDTRSVIPVIPVHSGCDIFDTVVQS